MKRQKCLVDRDGENVKFVTRLKASGWALADLPKITSALDIEEGYMLISGDGTQYRADHFRYLVFCMVSVIQHGGHTSHYCDIPNLFQTG